MDIKYYIFTNSIYLVWHMAGTHQILAFFLLFQVLGSMGLMVIKNFSQAIKEFYWLYTRGQPRSQ